MPIPSVKGKEDQSEFVSRCMGDSVMNKEYPDQKQRAAICYSQWRKAKKKKKSKGSTEEPRWEEQTFDDGAGVFLL
jgi:hypothetical protein